MKQCLQIILLMLLPAFLFGQTTINDASINAGQTVTLSSDTEYLLDGLVYVESGAELIIEPGTVIKAKQTPGNGDNTSALIIAKGGKIFANGTAQAPIIMTSEFDDLNNPIDLTQADRGFWGGVIILGNAGLNTTTGSGQIEGIDPNEPRGSYGGGSSPIDSDNSGLVRYMSIRHGGALIGSGNEINGLTLGGVGSGTIIEFVEVYANLDDGFEWFGGTVNTRYLIAAFCGDDSYDWDEGFRGKGQFWFAVQATDAAGRVAEMDGGTTPEDGTPYAIPTLSNITYIGPGASALPSGDGDAVLKFRDNTGGKYYNSIFTDYNGQEGGAGVLVEDLGSGEDSRARLEAGQLVLNNNVWWDFANGNSLTDFAPEVYVQTHLTANNNMVSDPGVTGGSRTSGSADLDPRPNAAGPAGSGADFSALDNFFSPVAYKGAFNPSGSLWSNGWTALSDENVTVSVTSATLTDASINAGETIILDGNTEYLMDGLVYVESGAELVIPAGTVIKAKQVPSNGDNTSALIIAQGGKITATGTFEQPIIMTSELDNITDPTDLTQADRGFWGGLIILGNAGLNTTTGVGQIEGIDPNEPRGAYGGGATPDDADNSGIVRYLSIRHGGALIGSGNEINGLTMGGVGSGTTIEYIEVYANLDDGYEWFGGTVNTKNLIAAFCGDDAYDWDEGFRGKGQFWFAVQGTDAAGRVAEMDGGTTPEDGAPYAIPTISNVTYIGPGSGALPSGDGDALLKFRDNTGGKYFNSIFTQFNGQEGGAGVLVEDLGSGEDSRNRLDNGDLVLKNNQWWDFANGNNLSDFAPEAYVQAHLTANNNNISDPQFIGVSRVAGEGNLDPRPNNSVASDFSDLSGDAFFSQVGFVGAFNPATPLWTNNWTALSQDNITTGIEETQLNNVVPKAFALDQNYPNPFNPETTIGYRISQAAKVTITVYNVSGQKVGTLVDGFRQAGEYQIRWNAVTLPTGVYFYQLRSGSVVETRKMMLVK